MREEIFIYEDFNLVIIDIRRICPDHDLSFSVGAMESYGKYLAYKIVGGGLCMFNWIRSRAARRPNDARYPSVDQRCSVLFFCICPCSTRYSECQFPGNACENGPWYIRLQDHVRCGQSSQRWCVWEIIAVANSHPRQ
jgi:hypothetical protein